MSSRDWICRIQDILKLIEKIERYIDGMTITQFKKDELVIDAVVRNFEIIGEASKSIPLSIRRAHPDLPWNEMSAMRNILIHEYFGVDVKILWHTAKNTCHLFKNTYKFFLQKLVNQIGREVDGLSFIGSVVNA